MYIHTCIHVAHKRRRVYTHIHIILLGTPQAEFTIDASYEEYLKEVTNSDISAPVDVLEEMQCIIKNKQNCSVTPIGPIANHITPGFFHQVISPSFTSSYVPNCVQMLPYCKSSRQLLLYIPIKLKSLKFIRRFKQGQKDKY